MRRLIGMPILIALALCACVTINVYFPAAEAREAARQFVEKVIGDEAQPSQPAPATTPNGGGMVQRELRFDPLALIGFLADQLNAYKLAYLHVMRADFFGLQKADVMAVARDKYKGVLIGNMGYTPKEAEQAIAEGKLDAVAFGTSFLANPDLPARIQAGAALNAPDASTFYTPGAKGYTDYPTM